MIHKKQHRQIFKFMKKLSMILSLFSFFISCNRPARKIDKKDFITKIEEVVLSENIKDKRYLVDIGNSKQTLKYEITLIGNIVSGNKNLNILYETVLSGNSDSPQLSSYLILYDLQGNRIGQYYIGSAEIPSIKNDNLIFTYQGGECDQTTSISFKNSIPKEIFINCTSEGGDTYTFQTK